MFECSEVALEFERLQVENGFKSLPVGMRIQPLCSSAITGCGDLKKFRNV